MLIRFMLCLNTLTISAAVAATEIALEDAPPEALETAIATAPGVDFTRVTVEEENGRRVFEFEGRGAAGEHIEIDVFEDGELDEIEIETDPNDLPPAVRATLEAEAPGMEVEYIEMSVRKDGVLVFEIEGRIGGGERLAVEIREDGTFLRRDSDEATS